MFNRQVFRKNSYMLNGSFYRRGYDWWWHSFTAINEKTGEEKPFYIEFFIINPGLSKDHYVLGQSKIAKELGLKPSYLMVNVGSWGKQKAQLHRFFSLKEVKIHSCPIQIEAGDCYLDEYRSKGSVNVERHEDGDMSDLGSMSWDLTIQKDIAWNVGYGTSKLFCDLKAFEMYWHGQGMKSYFEGTITFNGEKYRVEKQTSFGYCDKNWGCDFTTPWVWLSSNDIVDKKTGKRLENSVFDIGGGKPKVFGVSLPRKLLAGYYIEGKEFEMNFSKLISHPCKTEFSFDESDPEKVAWKVVQEDWGYQIITEVRCKKEEMLFINYETPDGKKPFSRLWNGGNGTGSLKIIDKINEKVIYDLVIGHVGCEYGEFDQ